MLEASEIGHSRSLLVAPEYNMKTSRVSHLASLPIVLAVPVLAFSLTIGGSHLVRADQSEMLPHVLRDMVLLPIMNAVQGLEQRLMSIETTVAALAVGISSPRVSTQQLCIADASGAQTCVTKAHLDALLRIEAQAEISQAPAETAAVAAPPAEAVDEVAETDVAEPSTSAAAIEPPREEQEPAEVEAVILAPAAARIVPDETPRNQPDQAELAVPTPAVAASALDEKVQEELLQAEIVAPAAEAEIIMTTPADPTGVGEPAAIEDDQEPMRTGTIPSAPAAAALVPSESAHDNLERPQIEAPAVTTAAADPVSLIAADSDQPAPTPNEN